MDTDFNKESLCTQRTILICTISEYLDCIKEVLGELEDVQNEIEKKHCVSLRRMPGVELNTSIKVKKAVLDSLASELNLRNALLMRNEDEFIPLRQRALSEHTKLDEFLKRLIN
ncbi:hypothetical protein TDB9533_03564 [Thalassocella blandensis]|nr:hypothetical protein TDB9533_03564 [Thalassocella blandensis]